MGKLNLGEMVEAVVLATYIKVLCQKRNLQMQGQFFEGLLAGYDHWFRTLKIPQDLFDELQEKIDKDLVMKRAEEYMDKAMGQQGRIIVPGVQDVAAAKAAKSIFDRQFKVAK
jgi:hypothetical protein